MALELGSGPFGQGTWVPRPSVEGGRSLGGYFLLGPQTRHITGGAQLEEARAGSSQVKGPRVGPPCGSKGHCSPYRNGVGTLALP